MAFFMKDKKQLPEGSVKSAMTKVKVINILSVALQNMYTKNKGWAEYPKFGLGRPVTRVQIYYSLPKC